MSELEALDQGFADLVSQEEVGRPLRQQQQPSHGLYVEFYVHPVEQKEESLKAGRKMFAEVPYIMIMVPGDKSSIVRRPVRTGTHAQHDNHRFHNEYVAFMQNEKQPVVGTPLSEWHQLNKAQVEEMKHIGIRTVEQLAGMPDSNVQKFMGLADLKQKARKWLETTSAEAPLQMLNDELEKRDSEIATMNETLKEMQKELAKVKKAQNKG